MHQRKVFEVVQVLAAGFQDAGAWYAVVVYDLVEAGIDFVGMAAEKRRMAHFGNLGPRFEIEVEARSGTAVDRLEIDSMVRSERETVHFGTVEDHSGTEEGRSEIEEAVHSEIGVESRARLAGEIVEAAQTPDFEEDQSSAVVGEMETAIVDKAVVAERKAEGRQSKTSFELNLQMAFAVAAAAGGDSLANQPGRDVLVQFT